MPPKKDKPSKKAVEKKKDKIVVDKTFGLKNKNKSKQVQKYIQGVEAAVKGSNKAKEQEMLKKKKREEEEARKKLEAELFKPAVAKTKVPTGVDPKSVVCEFFKKGMCTKGDKCKFSHAVEKKVEKIEEEQPPEETMDDWDQKKLEEVVSSKRGEENRNLKTTIVCKYFLEALDTRKYGYNWECPNGGSKCIYVHTLPPGYVLKSKKSEEEEEDEVKLSLEEQIEEEWKEEKAKEKEKAEQEKKTKREADIKSGKTMRSGREMFVFNPELFVDDEGVFNLEELEREDEGPVMTINVTGTSISATPSGPAKESNGGETENTKTSEGEAKVEVEESLFVEEDLPDDED